ncbi:MAG: hypothetical protein ACD_78C00073G0002 [uncultured bacterium (gcode 4)]|uniref:Cyclic nucleotide-binding domain-containing protein n=1 Tax=uncultured bacterium (gcode 4) TaxID=1234023 RepID=K1YY82_9BACT|nr:MAG: hypothetical protein ACD_78C00073G0002 [uncultured bacterium (gcode 4)]
MTTDWVGVTWLVFGDGKYISPKKPKEAVFYGDTYVLRVNGTKMTHEELEENEKALEDIVNKLISHSPVFYGFKATTIIRGIKSWKIPTVEIAPQTEIIKQWSKSCDFFYVLLRWEVGIYHEEGKGKVKVQEIKKMSVVGEMGYIDPDQRTATVMTEEKSFFLRFDRVFIETKLSKDEQYRLEKNLNRELIHKLKESNKRAMKALRKASKWNGWDTLVTREIEKQIQDMVYHTVEDNPDKLRKVN